jgi:hypothetical protein
VVLQVQHLGASRQRDRIIEDCWISVYNGSFHLDYEGLQRRGEALAEFLAMGDQYEDQESDISSTTGSNKYIQAKHRSSAVTGMSFLVFEWDMDNGFTSQERSGRNIYRLACKTSSSAGL